MSLKRTLHETSTFLAVLAFLFMRLASVSGAVACFGSDGHIALEGEHTPIRDMPTSVTALDVDQLSALVAPAEQYFLQQLHSPSCIDVGVAHASEQDAVTASVHHFSDLGAIAPTSVGLDVIAPKDVSRATLYIRGPPASGGILLHLRSVILLI